MSAIKEAQQLFKQNIIPLIKTIYKLQNSHYRNVSTDLLGTDRGYLWICGAHFGNHWYMVLFSIYLVKRGREREKEMSYLTTLPTAGII